MLQHTAEATNPVTGLAMSVAWVGASFVLDQYLDGRALRTPCNLLERSGRIKVKEQLRATVQVQQDSVSASSTIQAAAF